MGNQRVKFATQMDEALLTDLRRFAKSEGRQIQSVLEDAVEAYLNDKASDKPAVDVLALAETITEDYSETLKYLAQ